MTDDLASVGRQQLQLCSVWVVLVKLSNLCMETRERLSRFHWSWLQLRIISCNGLTKAGQANRKLAAKLFLPSAATPSKDDSPADKAGSQLSRTGI